MASARTGQRHIATPASLSPYPKSAITVEDWEARAPLADRELQSVNALRKACEERSLPVKFPVIDSPASASRPSTPSLRGKYGAPRTPSRPTTPRPGAWQRPQPNHPLHPKDPVQTPQQFYDWFALIDRSVAHSQEAQFRAHLESVSEHLGTCDRLMERVDEVQTEVKYMFEGWRGVEEGGRSLKDACEQLLDERDRLIQLTDSIGARLEYFQELEHATRMLNYPGESLVLQTDFLDMVERVDVCIEFLRAHRHFREAEIYLLRFQQCLTRAMTLIRIFFVGSLKALTVDISRRLSEKEVSETAQMHLLYTRFHSVSAQVAPLLGELERRTLSHPDDLSSLLSECHAAYFSARKSLLVGRLAEEIKGLDPSRTELVELTRAGCSYLKQLCIDEFSLYRSFFNSGKEQLYSYLENLCDYLYDDLRPRILHEPRLTVLCEVCTVLQALMVLDIPTGSDTSSEEEEEEDQDELTMDHEKQKSGGLGKLHISVFLQAVLQDAQTRLFFKAQSAVQAEIRYYVPKPEDLDYPNKLVVARKPTNGFKIQEKEVVSTLFQGTTFDKQETWYPTLEKTAWVLTQLHDFVQPAIFNDIAQEAIDVCRESLLAASDVISAKHPPSTKFDGQLFLIRHLLILKEMTSNLNLVHLDSNGGINLRNITETLKDMLRTSSLMPYAFAMSLGRSEDWKNMNAIEGIDRDLKRTCEDYIGACAADITQNIRAFVDKIRNSQLRSRPQEATQLSAFPSKDEAVEKEKEFRLVLQKELPGMAIRLRLYLEDSGTVSVLFPHVQDKIVDEYSAFREAARSLHDGDLDSSFSSVVDLRNTLLELCNDVVMR